MNRVRYTLTTALQVLLGVSLAGFLMGRGAGTILYTGLLALVFSFLFSTVQLRRKGLSLNASSDDYRRRVRSLRDEVTRV